MHREDDKQNESKYAVQTTECTRQTLRITAKVLAQKGVDLEFVSFPIPKLQMSYFLGMHRLTMSLSHDSQTGRHKRFVQGDEHLTDEADTCQTSRSAVGMAASSDAPLHSDATHFDTTYVLGFGKSSMRWPCFFVSQQRAAKYESWPSILTH